MAMWLVTLRDLQWRRRRFLIAVVAASLVFAMTLLLSGVSHLLRVEPGRLVGSLGADAFVVPAGSSGPFTATSVMDAGLARQVAASSKVKQVEPFVYFHATIKGKDYNVLGLKPGGFAMPASVDGRSIGRSGEVLTDKRGNLDVGERFNVLGHQATVVGHSTGTTFNFGTPTLFLSIADAQAMLFHGAALVTAFMTQGTPAQLKGLHVLTRSETVADMKRPLEQGESSINFINVLLWIVAAAIIGSIVYLSSLERLQDFAVLKATGSSSRSLVVGLAIQAVLLCLASAVGAALMAQLLKRGFPFHVDITTRSYILLPIVATAVGLLSSLAGLRKAVSVDPALAFG